MKLFAIVVLVLALFPVLLDRSLSCRAVPYPTSVNPTAAFTPSIVLSMGRARVEVAATVSPVHPNNRGFLDSTVSISTAVRVNPNPGVTIIVKAPFHLNLDQLHTPYINIRQWLQINSVCFIGGAIAVGLWFLLVGMALIRKQVVCGLPLQPELVVVPIPVRPNSPVIECRVPNTRASMPPAFPPRRPMIRRPLFNSTISRLGGPRNNTAPQPVAPGQPPRPGSWFERVSVEGKLVLCSHYTGPGGSLKWTVQYFPRHEHSHYLSQYPTDSSFDPFLQVLLGFRPLVVKVPGEIMEELFEFVFSEFKVERELDAASIPLPPSRPETLLPDLYWASNIY